MIRRHEPRQGAKRRGKTRQGLLEQEVLRRQRAPPRWHGPDGAFQQWGLLAQPMRPGPVPAEPEPLEAGGTRTDFIYLHFIYLHVRKF